MGLGGISIWQLLIILVIVMLLFGTKRLQNIGSDLGSAIKGFRSSMRDAEDEEGAKPADRIAPKTESGQTVNGEVTHKQTHHTPS